VSGVHFTDGFDRPDTIALGLDAPRLLTVVAGALSAYGVMQAPLPMALRVLVAVLVAGVSALLGWGRYAGRPLLSWAWLALRFTLSPRSGGGTPAVELPERTGAPSEPTERAGDSPEPQEGAGAAPEPPEDAYSSTLPPWARWLDMADEVRPPGASAPPMTASPDTIELSRDAPLVVVMGESRALDSNDAAAEPAHDDDIPDDAPPDDGAVPVVDLPGAADEPTGDGPERTHAHAGVLELPRRHNAAAAPFDLTPADAAPPPVFVGAPRRVTFFSLKGGSGRTTLATEVACILAARGRHQSRDGVVRPLEVALLDLDLHSATVAVRLGVAHPTLTDYLSRGGDPAHLESCMVRHRSGVHVLLGPPKPVASGPAAVEPARVAEIVHRLERDGAHFVVIDVGADLGAVTTWVLSAAHDVFIVVTPTASGVQDAYRSTEALRRLGLGPKLRYVVNRARGTPDLSVVMGDLGGRIAAVIPEDAAVEEAENNHRSVALDGSGPAAAALLDLAALLYPSLSNEPRRSRLGWLPWRRRVG
jgi:MinD-like ATPase involved in chromosome partitioning or flagellar assembly